MTKDRERQTSGQQNAGTDSHEEDSFEIGGEKLSIDNIAKIQAYLATLLKSETVSLLLGAGASAACGGQLMNKIPKLIERDLIERATNENPEKIPEWLKIFYLAVRCSSNADCPRNRRGISSRYAKLDHEKTKLLDANFEQVLATLYHWRSALSEDGNRLRVDGTPKINVKRTDLDKCIINATNALARACDLPTAQKRDNLAIHETLIRKLLTRPVNLKRVNIFTLNYDTLVEQAADAAGVTLLDGFVGTQQRVFRPESYEQDLYYPGKATEGRVYPSDRVLHLYKLHGSITWIKDVAKSDNPYGVYSKFFDPQKTEPLLIYPTPSKYGEILGFPYSEMFRRFANTLVRSQSVLFVIGFGFGDEHVNAIIRQALIIPSFTLVIVDPSPNSIFVKKLCKQNKQKDTRIWIIKGSTIGKFEGFVNKVLPDLRDGEIRRQAIETYNAVSPNGPTQKDYSNDS